MSTDRSIESSQTSTRTDLRPTFDWKRWPETEAFVEAGRLGPGRQRVRRSAWPGGWPARRAPGSTDWVDHLVIGEAPGLARTLAALGYVRQPTSPTRPGSPVFAHEGGMFPRIAVAPGPGAEVREVAIKVESVAAFSRAHDLGLAILGYPMGPYRVGRVEGRVDEPGGGRAARVSSGSTRSRARWPGSGG